MNNKIIISIENKTSDQIFDIEVFPNITVKNLKNKIGELFKIIPECLYSTHLCLVRKVERARPIILDENKTLFDYHIRNGSIICFRILDIRGGGGLPMKFSN